MVSLCQFVLARASARGSRCGSTTPRRLPFPAARPDRRPHHRGRSASLIGLPALRLSGLYLALITLMAAGAITILLRTAQFPNGGGGFFGNSSCRRRVVAPAPARRSPGRRRLLPLLRGRRGAHVPRSRRGTSGGKPGRAWAAIRQSEATAVAAGVNTTLYKLWAFALASFIAGVAGALLAAAAGGVSINQFPVPNSILLLAVVLMGGVYNLLGRHRRRAVPAPPARAARQLGRVHRDPRRSCSASASSRSC